MMEDTNDRATEDKVANVKATDFREQQTLENNGHWRTTDIREQRTLELSAIEETDEKGTNDSVTDIKPTLEQSTIQEPKKE